MAKLISTLSEGLAIRGICGKNREVRGHLMANLNESYFRTEPGKEAFAYLMEAISKKGEPPTFSIMCESIKLSSDTKEFLKDCENIPKTMQQAQQVVDTLNSYRKTYLLYTLAKDLLEGIEQKKVDLDALTQTTIDAVTEVQTGRDVGDTVFHFGVDANADHIVKDILYSEDDDQIIPTGYKAWDDKNGGFIRGSLVVIAGSTGAGKSQNAVQLPITQTRIGYKTLLVPLEMSKEAITIRKLANISGIDSLKILRKELATDEKEHIELMHTRYNTRAAKRGGRLTVFKPGSDITIEALMAAIHSFNADVIYIDYISLLSGADGDDQWRKLGSIARFCAVYADIHKKVVVLLCQVNEEGRLKYSQTIKEHASVMWSFVATKESKEQGYLKIIVDKARNQDGRPFTMKIDYALSRVYDFESSETSPAEGTTAKAKKPRKDDSMMPDLTED